MNVVKQFFLHLLAALISGNWCWHWQGMKRAISEKGDMKKWIATIFALLCLIFLVLILANGGNRELVWFIVPLGGLFRMIGGTWNKDVGRFLTPALVVVAVLLLVGWSWWLLPVYGIYLLVKTLPFTLIGSSVQDNWFNWVWIWMLGIINGACAFSLLPIVGWGEWLNPLIYSCFPMIIYGIWGTLSNVKATAKFFPWKFCEFMFGMSSMVPVALIIDQYCGGLL